MSLEEKKEEEKMRHPLAFHAEGKNAWKKVMFEKDTCKSMKKLVLVHIHLTFNEWHYKPISKANKKFLFQVGF